MFFLFELIFLFKSLSFSSKYLFFTKLATWLFLPRFASANLAVKCPNANL